MSLATVRSKILLKLQEMRSLRMAYDYEATNVDGKFPFATLTLKNGDGSFESSAHNLRRQSYRVKVYQEKTKVGQGSQRAEEICVAVLDELQLALDADTTLSGTVKWVRPVGWSAGYVDREMDTRILDIDLDAFELVSSQ